MSALSRWCDALRSAPARAQDRCDYVIKQDAPRRNHWRAWDETVDEAVSRVGFNGNRASFLGLGHDWWLYHNHAKYMEQPGVYLDLATNEPLVRNNAFFVDQCLGWRGLCFEPGPQHHARIRNLRNCQLVPTCVSNKVDGNVSFSLGTNTNFGGNAQLLGTQFGRARPARNQTVTLRCTTLSTELANANIAHVDFLSLDLEGHELPALSSVDFTKTTIDIIMCEDKTVWRASPDGPGGARSVSELLVTRLNYTKLVRVLKAPDGDRGFQNDDVYLRPGFQLGIERSGRRRIDGAWRCLYTLDGEFQKIRGEPDYEGVGRKAHAVVR